MDFIDQWRSQVVVSLVEAARLAVNVQGIDLEYSLLAVGVLWPLRQPVQDFNMEAIEAVNKLLGAQAKHVLRIVQGWDDDLMKAAQNLGAQVNSNPEIDTALNILIKQFRAFFIFADELSKRKATLEASPAAVEAKAAPPPPQAEAPVVEVTPLSVQDARVFISYARSDGEELARELAQRLEREDIPIWQDRLKMEGGRDWWLQITDALNEVEFMVLVMTPAAMRSEIVRKEWQYARQQGVCVYPIQGIKGLQFEELPRWMRNVHFYDINLEWTKLVQDLKSPCETPRVPFMVEALPDDFVSRAGQLGELASLLLDEQGDPIVSHIALYGTGGYGKTMLAKALVHDENIRQAFDDGILWVTLGENPGDITGRVIDLIEVLSGERPGFAGLDAAEARLGQLLADRDILMVIDDVWNKAHLKPFTQAGVRCARLITTRNIAALPPKIHTIEVGAMERSEAIALLSVGLPSGLLRPLQELADRLGEWPLLLKLTNGTLRERIFNHNQTLSDALIYVNKALDRRGLTAFDAHNAADRDQAVSQTLGVSQELLSEAQRERYGELAIFPGDVHIPLSVLEKLWGTTGGLDDFDTEELCTRLHQLSLLAHFDPTNRYIALHNIIRKYLAQEQGGKLVTLHDQFLRAYAAGLPVKASGRPDWASLPYKESYLWTHLAYHLSEARRGAELVETVSNLRYLINKAHLRGTFAAEADLLAAREADPDDNLLIRLHQAFSQSSHLFSECETVEEITNTLHSHLRHSAGLNNVVTAAEAELLKPLLTAERRLPDLPDTSLIRTIAHGAAVLACDLSDDGATAVTMMQDTTLKIWDTLTGAERFTLSGDKIVGNSCVISADGTLVVSTTWEGKMKIWDGVTGVERLSIKAHAAPIFACAISSDGSTVVTASKDKTLKIWDANTGALRHILSGHERSVTGCDITADGTTIVSASPDGTTRLWKAQTGELLTTLKAYEAAETHNQAANLTFTAAASALLNCAISPDGALVVSSLPDGLLKVWETRTGAERFILKGHTGWIEGCVISGDGRLIVSASNDKTVRGWDARTGAERFVFEGHLRAVTDCAVSADSSIIASVSQDKTLKLWDAEAGAEQGRAARHVSTTQVCAVSPDGQNILFDVTGNALVVIETQSWVERCLLKGHMRPITGCVISQDGKLVVSASQDRTVKLWDMMTGTERLTLRGHMWAVNDCAVSPDGAVVVSASEDSTLKVWDVQTGNERFTLTGHMRGVNGCDISLDGSFIVSASADKTLKVWETQTGVVRFTLEGHTGPVTGCKISSDGQLIVSTSGDNTLKIWSSQTGALCLTLTGHASPVARCAFSPDNQFLLSVSRDKRIKLWEVKSGACLTTLRVDGSLADCTWFPDGRRILAVGLRGVYALELL
jgi:WD40 repeat protein